MLGLEHYVDHYEFSDEGDNYCRVTGMMSMQGAIHTTEVKVIRILAVMFLGLRETRGMRIFNINNKKNDTRLCNIGVETMKEYFERQRRTKERLAARDADTESFGEIAERRVRKKYGTFHKIHAEYFKSRRGERGNYAYL